MDTTTSEALFSRATTLIPGGVNSPVRAFGSVGGTPRFIREAKGVTLTDADGNAYLDAVGSWGPMILGHAHPRVVAAIQDAAQRGTSFGAPTSGELELAEHVLARYPGCERVRFVNSGTEATMSALRLARAFTGRSKIIKFAGCYHGHADLLLVQAGSGVATFGLPDSPGVPAGTTADTLVAPFNDLEAVEDTFARYGEEIAAIIVEPVPANMGVVMPETGYLEGLRRITSEHGAVLIFDEVLSGFRVSPGGAAERYGVTPDVVTLGKVMGGGFPLAAYAGRREIMETVSPLGAMYQGGTLSGNPVATAAGIATLRKLREPGVFAGIEAKAARLITGMTEAANDVSLPVQTSHLGTLGGCFFVDRPVRDYADAKTSDTARYARFFHGLLRRGVAMAPSQFEAIFLSSAHTEQDIDDTLQAIGETMHELAVATR